MGRYRFKKYKDSKKKKKSYLIFIVVVFLTLLAFLVFFLTRARYWDGKTKLSVVINERDNVLISTFDPTLEEVTTVKIPASTQVEVSRSLGSWKLGSVWKLGKNEKVGGRLLQETIVKNFNFSHNLLGGH